MISELRKFQTYGHPRFPRVALLRGSTVKKKAFKINAKNEDVGLNED